MPKYKCSGCPYFSYIIEHAQRHIDKKKTCNEGLLQIIVEKEVIECEFCEGTFSTPCNLKRHLTVCKKTIEEENYKLKEELVKLKENAKLKEELAKLKENMKLKEELAKLKKETAKMGYKQTSESYKTIPKTLRVQVWNKYIGVQIGETNCPCCGVIKISPFSFVCGHVIAEAKGGDISLQNLRPICSVCNGSMGTRNMFDFMKEFSYTTLLFFEIAKSDNNNDIEEELINFILGENN